jgi:hypothetical protein
VLVRVGVKLGGGVSVGGTVGLSVGSGGGVGLALAVNVLDGVGVTVGAGVNVTQAPAPASHIASKTVSQRPQPAAAGIPQMTPQSQQSVAGLGVRVGVAVRVLVAVTVAVRVGLSVGVAVAVRVAVRVLVEVGVVVAVAVAGAVGVAVNATHPEPMTQTASGTSVQLPHWPDGCWTQKAVQSQQTVVV